MVNCCMSEEFKQIFGLAAPPTALPEDAPDMKIGAMKERISAISEGRAMVDFVVSEGYRLEVSADDIGSVAACNPAIKHIIFNHDINIQDMMSFFAHEVFHAMQFLKMPEYMGTFDCLVYKREKLRGEYDRNRPIKLLHPQDIHHAGNIMEMGAYAAQTHITSKLARETGDENLLQVNAGLHSAYDFVKSLDCLDGQLMIGDLACTRQPEGDMFEQFDREAVATAFAAYVWFWDGRSLNPDSKFFRLIYHDGMVNGLLKRAFDKSCPYFPMKEDGYKFEFHSMTDAQARLMGQGFGMDIFGIPAFDDVMSDKYRNEITKENKDKLMVACQYIGAPMVHSKPTV